MFESPIIAKFTPQMMDKFKEGKTTKEMVRLGVEKGYKLSFKTPDFLYGYEEVLELLFNTPNSYKYVNDENFVYMLKVENKRRELIDYILNNYSSIYIDFKTYIDIFKNIEVNDKTADFIKSKLGFAYLKENPEFMYTNHFSFNSYLAYGDEICELVIERDLGIQKILKEDDIFFAHLIEFKPELLLDEQYHYFLDKQTVEFKVFRMIKDGKIGITDLPEKLVLNSYIFMGAIRKDFTNLDKIIIYKDDDKKRCSDIAVRQFVKFLPESLEYLPNVSSFVGNSYSFDKYQMFEILNAIRENNYYITHCDWDFILRDEEIVLNSIRNNPNVLNTCSSIFDYVKLSFEEIEEIADIVINNNIVLHVLHPTIMKNDRLARYAFKNNPDLLNFSKEIYFYPSPEVLKESLDVYDIEVNAGTYNRLGVLPYELWIDAIRRNPFNAYSINDHKLGDEELLELYHVYLEHNIPLKKEMIYKNFNSNPKIILEALKQKKLRFDTNLYKNDFGYGGYNQDNNILNLYLIANYGKELKNNHITLPNIPLRTFEEKLEYFSHNIFYSWDIEEEFTDEQQKKISEIYFRNRERFFNAARLKVFNENLYIVVGEMIQYDNYSFVMRNGNVLSSKSARDYFTQELIKHNKKVNDRNIEYITDLDLIIEYANDNEYVFFDILEENFTEDDKAKVAVLIVEKLREGKILISQIPNYYILENFSLMQEVFTGNEIAKGLYYSTNDFDKCKKYIVQLYKEGKCDISPEVFCALDFEDALTLLKERPACVKKYFDDDIAYLSEEIKREASKMFSNENFYKYSFDVNHKYSAGEIIDLLVNGYYTTKDLISLYEQNYISIESYNYYYTKLLTDVMNGKVTSVDEISIVNPYYDISYQFLEYCAKNKFEMFCRLLKTFDYNLVDNTRIISIIINNLESTKKEKAEDILDSLSSRIRNIIFHQKKDLVTSRYFNHFFNFYHSSYTFTEEEIYDIWLSLNKPESRNYYSNKYILQDVLLHSKEKLKVISEQYFYVSEEQMLMVYDAFKNDEVHSILEYPILFDNVFMLNKLLNTNLTYKDYCSHYDILFLLCKNNQQVYNYCCENYKDKFKRFIKNTIEKDPLKLIDIFNYETFATKDIADGLVKCGYIINESTPKCYYTDALIINTLKNNPETIDFIKNSIGVDSKYGHEVTLLMVQLLMERNLCDIVNYELFYADVEYMKKVLRNNPDSIDKFSIHGLNNSLLFSYFEIVLELVREGKYKISDKTSKILFYNEELYEIAKEQNPELLNGFSLTGMENVNRDNKLIEEAIKNPSEVNKILAGREKVCEEELLNKLVSELININYIPTNDTPLFLYSSYKFMEYCIINNYVTDQRKIEKFATLENLYKTQNIELFRRLLDKGYGCEFKKIIFALGTSVTLELGLEYGYLLNRVNYGNVRIKNDVYREIIRKFIHNRDPETFTRCLNPDGKFSYLEYDFCLSEMIEIFFSDKEKYSKHIDELIRIDYYFSKNEMPFVFEDDEFIERFINISTNRDRITSFVNNLSSEKLTDKLILIAIKRGYRFNEDSHEKIKSNLEYVRIGLSFINDKIELRKVVNSLNENSFDEEIVKTIVNKGYNLDTNSPTILKSNSRYIKIFIESISKDNAYYIGNIINAVDLNILNDVIDETNINQLALIFSKYYKLEQDYLNLFEKFCSVPYEKRRKLIFRVLFDSSRIKLIKSQYEKYVFDNFEKLELNDLDKVINCLYRIENSNSGEIRQFATSIISELLSFDNYEEKFVAIEKIFLQTGIPMVSKLFAVFKMLHYDYSAFDHYDKMSPILKNSDKETRDKIIYRDLIVSAVSSNNRSLKEYLKDMSDSCNIVEEYVNGKIDKNSSDLFRALNFLVAIINSEYIINHIDKELVVDENIDEIISSIKKFFNYQNGDLRDAIVQALFDFKSYDLIIHFMNEIVSKTNTGNREKIEIPFTLEAGDLVKGLGSINYLTNILQNGSVAREFLGDSAGSDATPLDTDCSLIEKDAESLMLGIESTEAREYGPIWIVVKKSSNNFIVSRTIDGEVGNCKYTPSKMEAFYTGAIGNTHYGIRSGFPSSMIDYFLVDSFDERLGLEIALNGFYIPVVSKQNGEVLFTPEMYDDLRNKMSGLTLFEAGPYKIANYDDLMILGISELMLNLDENRLAIKHKHEKIKEAIAKAVSESNFKLKDKLDGDLIPGYVDLIDTGSTARGTDLPGKADFDYICRVDRDLFMNKEKFSQFRKRIVEQFTNIETEEYVGDNFRFKGVTVPGLDGNVDIDVSFVIRTTKLSLSSDESLLARLNAIGDGQYVLEDQNDLLVDKPKLALDLVTANILMAKKLMKKFDAYKKHSSPEAHGGLGGIGIENWILQHGGSLKRAAEDFLRVANICDTYEQFKQKYQIWDFGENHYAFEKSVYPHDDFVYNNMDANGYAKMKKALTLFLEYGTKVFNDDELKEIEVLYEQQMKDKTLVDYSKGLNV